MAELKLQFEANQKFQKDAIDAIVDVFDGQEMRQSKYTILTKQASFGGSVATDLGFANALDLTEEDLIKNVWKVQDRHHLPRSKKLNDERYSVPNFAIEMETGTGKTYVYTRTILELNQKYGMTKFIIVVPSVAIREGVKKSLEVTRTHFKELYPGTGVNFFVYDSDHLERVKEFASSDVIEIMIINIDAFRKGYEEGKDNKATRIHKVNDKMEGRRPIEFIRETSPIVIIDEPQSVDNTDKAKEAIKSLNPLCVIRYSATHRKGDHYNFLYRLGPVDAYEQRLVKAIEVAEVEGVATGPYMRLEKARKDSKGVCDIDICLRVLDNDGQIASKTVKANCGSRRSLYDISGKNHDYKPWIITNIDASPTGEYVEFENGEILRKRTDDNDLTVKRAQLATTIETHLDKEVKLLGRGIKVLSLIFIDQVSKYRIYNDDGSVSNGIYGDIFEEEYLRIIKFSKYHTLFTTQKEKEYALRSDANVVHDGYFSIDKKKQFKDSRGDGSSLDDESTYDLIMKDKEKLLSLDTPLRFIFSHSALKEGWDNPNVFQVCTLVDTADTMTKRQKIGRGLRLPVDQSGKRVRDDNVNILTVIANESYKSFSSELQHEIERDTSTNFGVIPEQLFMPILIEKDGIISEAGYEVSKKIHESLRSFGYIDDKDKATSILKEVLAKEDKGIDALQLLPEYTNIKKEIITLIMSVLRTLPVFRRSTEVQISKNSKVIKSDDFIDLWEKIKYRTRYQVNFDGMSLVEKCSKALSTMKEIEPSSVIVRKSILDMDRSGITARDPHSIKTYVSENVIQKLPDILRYIERFTKLTKKDIAKILVESKTLNSFRINPEGYMQEVVKIINEEKRKTMIDSIEYSVIGEGVVFSEDIFDVEKLTGYLDENAIKVEKSPHSHVIYQSTIEKNFAERLEKCDEVRLYTKLPSRFAIDTPLGDYNPDWAIVINKDGTNTLYFVVETKGVASMFGLRPEEAGKIECGRKHFAAIGTGIRFDLADDFDKWFEKVS